MPIKKENETYWEKFKKWWNEDDTEIVENDINKKKKKRKASKFEILLKEAFDGKNYGQSVESNKKKKKKDEKLDKTDIL